MITLRSRFTKLALLAKYARPRLTVLAKPRTCSGFRFSTQAEQSACFGPQAYMTKPPFGGFVSPVRPRRIGLLSRPWQGRVLPLNHGRLWQASYHEARAVR